MRTDTGVYQIRNLHNDKRYIGSSTNLTKRAWTHFNDLKHGQHHSIPLQRAYEKYGHESLSFEVMILCDREDLQYLEQGCLDNLGPEYNIATEVGKVPPPKKGVPQPWHRGNTYAKGNTSRLGKPHTREAREKISKAKMGNKSRTGMKHSEETKRRISISITNWHQDRGNDGGKSSRKISNDSKEKG